MLLGIKRMGVWMRKRNSMMCVQERLSDRGEWGRNVASWHSGLSAFRREAVALKTYIKQYASGMQSLLL
jgi:hypothetical protein